MTLSAITTDYEESKMSGRWRINQSPNITGSFAYSYPYFYDEYYFESDELTQMYINYDQLTFECPVTRNDERGGWYYYFKSEEDETFEPRFTSWTAFSVGPTERDPDTIGGSGFGYDTENGWENELDRWINFGQTPVELPSQVYAWLMRNAQQDTSLYDTDTYPIEIDPISNTLKITTSNFSDTYQIYGVTNISEGNIIQDVDLMAEYCITPEEVTEAELTSSIRPIIEIPLNELSFTPECSGGIEHNIGFSLGTGKTTSDAIILVLHCAGTKYRLPSNKRYFNQMVVFNRPLNAPILVLRDDNVLEVSTDAMTEELYLEFRSINQTTEDSRVIGVTGCYSEMNLSEGVVVPGWSYSIAARAEATGKDTVWSQTIYYTPTQGSELVVQVTRTKNYVVLDTKNKFCPENIKIVLVDNDGKANSSIPADTLTIGTNLQRSKGSITLLTKGKLCEQPIKVNIVD